MYQIKQILYHVFNVQMDIIYKMENVYKVIYKIVKYMKMKTNVKNVKINII